MFDQSDKPVNSRNIVFDEENHEQKAWKLFERTCKRSILVFCANFLI